MKILFLGTSSGWPLPRLGCKCHICTSTNLKDQRLRPSILIDEHILIDAPPDIYHQIKKFGIDPTKITHIFLTHAHDDHIMGLYDLSRIYRQKNKYSKNEKVKIVSAKSVLSRVRSKMGPSMFSFINQDVTPFKKLQIGNLNFWFLSVRHPVETYAIKIKGPKPILYASEFRSIQTSAKKHLGDLDLAIIDGSSKTREGQAKGHETIEEGLRLGKELHAKKVLFTNIGHKTDTHVNLVQFVQSCASNKFNVAFDGLEIIV